MDEVNTDDTSRVGETIAEVNNGEDIQIVEDEPEGYVVNMPSGNKISTTLSGIQELESLDWSSPPWEQPDPNPLDPDPDDKIGTFTTPQTRTVESKINYICPECDGQFRSWLRESGGIGDDDTYMCPFCKTERGDYGEDTDVTIEEAVEVVREKLEEEEDAQWFAELLGVVESDQ